GRDDAPEPWPARPPPRLRAWPGARGSARPRPNDFSRRPENGGRPCSVVSRTSFLLKIEATARDTGRCAAPAGSSILRQIVGALFAATDCAQARTYRSLKDECYSAYAVRLR